jgi:hypothetical protein
MSGGTGTSTASDSRVLALDTLHVARSHADLSVEARRLLREATCSCPKTVFSSTTRRAAPGRLFVYNAYNVEGRSRRDVSAPPVGRWPSPRARRPKRTLRPAPPSAARLLEEDA